MTSILPVQTHPPAVAASVGLRDKSESMGQLSDSIIQRQRKSTMDDKGSGGRRRGSRATQEDSVEAGSQISADEDAEGNSSGGEEGPARKRRRSRKGLNKKFECPTEGCGKSYSRAEHLYRHQLNHTPKQIYNCDFPDCTRTFVRQDLCARHKERHTTKGSQLNRKDSMMRHGSPGIDIKSEPQSSSPEMLRPTLTTHNLAGTFQYQAPRDIGSGLYPNGTNTSTIVGNVSGQASSNSLDLSAQGSGTFKRSNSDSISRSNASPHPLQMGRQPRHASFGMADATSAEFARPQLQAPVAVSYTTTPGIQAYHESQASPQQMYVTQQNFSPFSLPPPGFSAAPKATTASVAQDLDSAYPTSMSLEYPNQQSGPDMMLLDQMAGVNAMPVFGGEGYSRSPFAIPEDFIAYLFNNQQIETSLGNMSQQGYTNYPDVQNQYMPYYSNDVNLGGFYPPGHIQQPHPMAVTSLLDTSLPESIISEEKSQAIVDLIKERFNETDHAPVARQKEALLEGDRNNDSHMLSRKMMQTYIGSYWYNFSEQIPILHKPTFSPDKTPNLLLVAMMAIGAACLDKMHGHEVTQAGAELSNFLAWHLRWEIFSDAHFRPPAKLWIFQALILLEIYEKMLSTRALHERSHIHHATTITLMRRGSSLIGRSALDSPPSVRDDKSGLNGSRHSSASGANTPDDWWNHWIINEATRRAAFAAFVIDSTHATMFGHSTVMVAHEMRLPLPYDEALWSATNSAEVGRIEASLHANGVKPMSFLEGLKRTLNGQEVRTNSFGRTILMAGLLSVCWHMNQRDLQVNSLGVTQALGGRDKWRGSLTKAFDLWRRDFDKSLARTTDVYSKNKEDTVVFESRTVLHHLAHMAMHVDIVDCQIFARAKRLLGRTISSQDLNGVQRRMKDSWAPTARARDATYYALQFLCITLLPEGSSPSARNCDQGDPPFDYSARDDVLLNRSWVMYFATLIIWSYGYALEGPSTAHAPPVYDFDEQVRDMRAYLRRLGSVRSPEDLKQMRGFNGCTGLLMVLRSVFEKTRWELLHEAALLLTNCIQLVGHTSS